MVVLGIADLVVRRLGATLHLSAHTVRHVEGIESMTERADIYIGRNGKPDANTLDAVASLIGGYTITKGEGGWLNDQDTLVTERCYIVTLIGNGRQINDAADELADHARAMGEECILVVRSECSSGMLYGR